MRKLFGWQKVELLEGWDSRELGAVVRASDWVQAESKQLARFCGGVVGWCGGAGGAGGGREQGLAADGVEWNASVAAMALGHSPR